MTTSVTYTPYKPYTYHLVMTDNNQDSVCYNKYYNITQLFTTSLLRALAFIHTAGIIHLDVKPENVMFARWGPKLKLP